MVRLKIKIIRLFIILVFSYVLSACIPTNQSVIMDTIHGLGSSESPYKPIKFQLNINKDGFISLFEIYLNNYKYSHYSYDESTNKIQTTILRDKTSYQEFQLNILLEDNNEKILVTIDSEFSFYSMSEERRIPLSYKVQQENTHKNVRESVKEFFSSKGIEIVDLN